jgi:hypothetical protein
MENRGIFYDHLVYFTAIRNILWPFGIGILWSFGIFFTRLGILYQEVSGNPGAWLYFDCHSSDKTFLTFIGPRNRQQLLGFGEGGFYFFALGVDVMIKIFCHFRQFSAKNGVFAKKQC